MHSRIGCGIVPFLRVSFIAMCGLDADALTKLDLSEVYPVDDEQVRVDKEETGGFSCCGPHIRMFLCRAYWAYTRAYSFRSKGGGLHFQI